MPRLDLPHSEGPTVRMEDVAKYAGVALGTVSNVLNRPQKVSPRTIQKVQEAIETLGFVPNRAARALAAGTSRTVGIVVADLSNSFFVDIARGVEREAAAAGLNVVIANSDMSHDRQATNVDLFRQERMAGILVAPLPGAPKTLHPSVAGPPVVFLNDAALDGACTVSVDNEYGGYLAAAHLLAGGRRRLLFAGNPEQAAPISDRYLGARRAVDEVPGAGLTLVATDEVQVADGRLLAQRICATDPADRPDGIVAAADLLAVGLVQVLSSTSDIRIPEDIAITGYDNNRAAWDSLIPITTIAQPGEELGAAAMRLLCAEMRRDGEPPHSHEHAVLKPALVVRASTAG